MSFSEEKKILSHAFTKSFKQLCEKYNFTIPDDVVGETVSNFMDTNLKIVLKKMVNVADPAPEEEEMDADELDSEGSSTSSEASSASSSSENDDGGFMTVQNKRRMRNQRRKAVTGEKKTKESETTAESRPENYFQLLQPKEPKKGIPTPMPEEKRQPRPPPIICFNLNIARFYERLYRMERRPKFFIKNSNKTRCIIKPATEEDHQVLFKVVQEIKVDCYSFTPKEERKSALVLKGIQCSFTPEQIQAALKEELPDIEIANVSHLITPKIKERGRVNAFVVTVGKDSDVHEVTKVNRLLYQVVYWEKYRSAGILQCKNCKAYGHVTSNCGKRYRCVKCNEDHGPKEGNLFAYSLLSPIMNFRDGLTSETKLLLYK